MRKNKRLSDAYRFKGFTPEEGVRGVFGDPRAVVIRLKRKGKKRFARCVGVPAGRSMTTRFVGYETCPAGTSTPTWKWRCGGCSVSVAAR